MGLRVKGRGTTLTASLTIILTGEGFNATNLTVALNATEEGGSGGSGSVALAITALAIYLMSFSFGMGPGAWLIPSEGDLIDSLGDLKHS